MVGRVGSRIVAVAVGTLAYTATGATPPDSTSQLPLHENLLDGAPPLTPSEIPQ